MHYYNAGNKEYGVIFSVDGNGNITRHFPENSWQAEALEHDFSEIPLDFSYELDNAPDFECFIMVTSKQQFTLDDLEDKIKNKTDINYLKKFPKVGDKVARQIVLDLKGKLIETETSNIKTNEELVEALEALGYKKQDIKKVIPNVKSEKIEDQIKEALKLLLK